MLVAILGFGTVGSGVMEVIEKNADRIAQNAAQEIRVKYIVDVRDFPDSPYASLMVKDFSVVENDPEIKTVVETIGGTGVAYDFTRRCLLAGKNVVTSNKELVATHGHELIDIARQKNVNYLFEASVGGGIPILRPITQCLAANKINDVYGILNGTTNYILTEMIKNGTPFDAALKAAQAMGYAEADPTADIEGYDACRKICILSALCYGRHMYPKDVLTEGITGVSAEDVENAARIGCKIKLLGRAVLYNEHQVAAYVAPHLVSRDNLISSVEGVMNGIVVRGNAIGDVMFYGAGAGKYPTASAVVADVIDAAKHLAARKYIGWEDGGAEYVYPPELVESRWYVRCEADAGAARAALGEIEPLENAAGGKTAFVTVPMSKKAFDGAAAGLGVLSALRLLD